MTIYIKIPVEVDKMSRSYCDSSCPYLNKKVVGCRLFSRLLGGDSKGQILRCEECIYNEIETK